MMNRPRVNIPPGSPMDLFGRYGMQASDPAFDNPYMTHIAAPQLEDGQSSQGYLPPFTPGLSPQDMDAALQTFGMDNLVQAYPQDMDAGAIADAIIQGMKPAADPQSVRAAIPATPSGGLKSMLTKAAPYAIALGAQALTSKAGAPKQQPLNFSQPSAIPVSSLGPTAPAAMVTVQSSQQPTMGPFGNQSKFMRGY